MFTKGVSSVLDYSVEGKEEEEQFDLALQMTLKTIEFAKEKQAIPFAVFKPTGFGRLDLYTKLGEGKKLSVEEQNEMDERFSSSYEDYTNEVIFQESIAVTDEALEDLI